VARAADAPNGFNSRRRGADSHTVAPADRSSFEGGIPPRQSRRFDASTAERRRLGDVLVESGLITAEQLQAALREQKRVEGPRRRIGQVITDLGFASERDVAECLARLLNLELVDLSKMTVLPEHIRLLPRAVAERTRVLVMDRSDSGLLTVAAADPTNVLAFDDVRLYTRSTDIELFVATDSQIRDQINRAWSLSQDSGGVADIVEAAAGTAEDEYDTSGKGVAEDAPIVRFVNQVLGDAVRTRASDIHLEVERDSLRVRYRIDGLLREVTTAPKRLSTSVISRIKIISGLDIAERRVPQDGRTRFAVEGHAIDARISTLPSLHGEKVVIRLLTRGDAVPSLAELGLEPEQLILLETALAVPQGLILITGPTGSGKTNTLYSAIATIRSPELNIVTLEDPVEVQLPGITQVGVNEKTGMTFGRGLRSILRQDPDIILVGEVRDGETAELALKAAMTGHLVLTTLHTNSAVAALTRLIDMGAQPFMVASSLTASVAQRLVRRPCASCAEPYLPDDLTLTMLGLVPADLAGASPRRGTGCSECGNTGYKGRTAVYEILSVDAAMRQIMIKEPSEAAISAQARAAGMVTLRAAAIIKALRGQTTFEEAVRVTHADHAGGSSCPVCERPVGSDMVACPWCAATLDRGQCPTCARSLDPDWRICPWCRTPAVRTLAPVHGYLDGAPGGYPQASPGAYPQHYG
jgi:type IV pilus assembly protein PilB